MRAAVIGASGAIGGALVTRLAASGRFERVHALSRTPPPSPSPTVIPGNIDLDDAASIRSAADAIAGPLHLVLVATGLLHDATRGPERALRDLDPDWLARVFAVNTIGPALVLRHFTPLLPKAGRSVIAAVSARVGSISDNRSGGWYGYRASKAALNMIIRCAAVELGRTRPDAVCVGLHPGTVASALSRPFQSRVPSGKLFEPGFAAECLLGVLDRLTPGDSGGCFAWDGTEIAP